MPAFSTVDNPDNQYHILETVGNTTQSGRSCNNSSDSTNVVNVTYIADCDSAADAPADESHPLINHTSSRDITPMTKAVSPPGVGALRDRIREVFGDVAACHAAGSSTCSADGDSSSRGCSSGTDYHTTAALAYQTRDTPHPFSCSAESADTAAGGHGVCQEGTGKCVTVGVHTCYGFTIRMCTQNAASLPTSPCSWVHIGKSDGNLGAADLDLTGSSTLGQDASMLHHDDDYDGVACQNAVQPSGQEVCCIVSCTPSVGGRPGVNSCKVRSHASTALQAATAGRSTTVLDYATSITGLHKRNGPHGCQQQECHESAQHMQQTQHDLRLSSMQVLHAAEPKLAPKRSGSLPLCVKDGNGELSDAIAWRYRFADR